jgi:hypothetical protein
VNNATPERGRREQALFLQIVVNISPGDLQCPAIPARSPSDQFKLSWWYF